LLAQIAETRFEPCGGHVRYDLNGGSKGIAGMSAPVGPGFWRRFESRFFLILGLYRCHYRTGRILVFIPRGDSCRKVLQLSLYLNGTRWRLGFTLNHDLARGAGFLLGLPLSFATLHS
jgi:hypothetical protein